MRTFFESLGAGILAMLISFTQGVDPVLDKEMAIGVFLVAQIIYAIAVSEMRRPLWK